MATRGGDMFRVHQYHDVSVIDAEGELSRHNVETLDDVLMHLAQGSHHNVILNMEGVSHLDYRLVRHLADRIIEFQCDGGDIKMANVNTYLRSIMEAMGLEEELYPSVEEAVLSFIQEGMAGSRH